MEPGTTRARSHDHRTRSARTPAHAHRRGRHRPRGDARRRHLRRQGRRPPQQDPGSWPAWRWPAWWPTPTPPRLLSWPPSTPNRAAPTSTLATGSAKVLGVPRRLELHRRQDRQPPAMALTLGSYVSDDLAAPDRHRRGRRPHHRQLPGRPEDGPADTGHRRRRGHVTDADRRRRHPRRRGQRRQHDR